MPDAPRRLPMEAADPDLERALADLAASLSYPPTPDLAERVRARLAAAPRSGPSRVWLGRAGWPAWRPLVLAPGGAAVAALLALLLGALAVMPGARETLADRLGLRGVTIRQNQPAGPLPTPDPLGARLSLGERVGSLAEARARVGFPVLAPAPEAGAEGLGAPDEVYVATDDPPGGRVALLYRARPGLPAAAQTGVGVLLLQVQGSVEPALMGKMLGSGSSVEAVQVGGSPGIWIGGGTHVVFFRDARGAVRDETLRLAANVLLWEQAGVTLRLEGAFDRDTALRLAASLRP